MELWIIEWPVGKEEQKKNEADPWEIEKTNSPQAQLTEADPSNGPLASLSQGKADEQLRFLAGSCASKVAGVRGGSMEQRVWRRRYSAFVGLPCPHCGTGKLKTKADTLHRQETAYSRYQRSEEGGSYHSLEERFSCLLVCDKTFCKEVVAIGGFVDIDEEYGHDQDGEATIHETTYFCPKSMYPAPRVIAVSKKLSAECQKDLISSFGVAVGRLRRVRKPFAKLCGTLSQSAECQPCL
ncbi:hypothetical protein ACOJBO_08275 [Rhizobium beringeri]